MPFACPNEVKTTGIERYQDDKEPVLITNAAVERSTPKDLLSGRSRVRVAVGAHVLSRQGTGSAPMAPRSWMCHALGSAV